MDTLFTDQAKPILAGDQALTDEHRAALWDIFHESKDHNELAQKLQSMTEVPDNTKRQLVRAKQQASSGPTTPVTTALNEMTKMDPAALDLAESHPTVLKTLMAALAPPEKTEKPASGKKPALALPPRPDGAPHFPSIPDGHKRVLASDLGIHDIPEDRIADAFKIDPQMHIMNP